MPRLRFSAKRKQLSTMHDISLTPLIDVVLTLLIIFIIASPMMHNAIKINLPGGKSKEGGTQPQALIVYIDKEKNIFFNGIPVTKDNLVNTLEQALSGKNDQTVFVKADTLVSYGHVIEIVDYIKVVAGVQYVALATQRV